MGVFTDLFGISTGSNPEKRTAEDKQLLEAVPAEESSDTRDLVTGYKPMPEDLYEVRLEYIQVLKTDIGVLQAITRDIGMAYLTGGDSYDGSGRMQYEHITIHDEDKSKVDEAAEKIRALSQMRYDEWQARTAVEVTKLEAYMTSEAWLQYK